MADCQELFQGHLDLAGQILLVIRKQVDNGYEGRTLF